MNIISSLRKVTHTVVWSRPILTAIAFVLSLVIVASSAIPSMGWIASGIVFATNIVTAGVVVLALLAMALFAIFGIDITHIGEE